MKKLPTIIAVFLLFLSLFFFNKHLNAATFDFDCDVMRVIEEHYAAKVLTPCESMDYHNILGAICMKKVEENLYWYLPKYNDLQLAKMCFTTAMSGVAPADPRAKAAAMFLTLLGQYGLDVMDRYQEVVSLGHQAQYHYEMYVFFAQLVAQGK